MKLSQSSLMSSRKTPEAKISGGRRLSVGGKGGVTSYVRDGRKALRKLEENLIRFIYSSRI